MLLSEVTNALVVFAHCDDAEWFFGGTVARLVAQGAEVNYVVCTDGSSGGVDLTVSDEELAATRAAEQRAAADVLGVGEVVFLGYHNDELTVTRRAQARPGSPDPPLPAGPGAGPGARTG